jgi:replicative DNA helicase
MLPAIKDAAAKLSKLPLSVVEKSIAPMTPTEVRRLARGLHGRDGSRVGLVVVDYLQLLTPDAKATSREREVAEMSRAFKQLALDCDCPVLLLSQLNRSVEESDRSPQLSDLRESGAIEQDADIVLFLHSKRSFRGLARMPVQAIVAKGRSSGTGAASMIFDKPFSDFVEDDGSAGEAYSRPVDDNPDF